MNRSMRRGIHRLVDVAKEVGMKLAGAALEEAAVRAHQKISSGGKKGRKSAGGQHGGDGDKKPG